MKILKTLMVAIFSLLTVALLFTKFTTIQTNYLCTEQSSSNTSKKLLFLTIEKQHPWSTLWTKTSGNIRYRIPLKESGKYNHTVQKENVLQIFKFKETTSKGSFSQENNSLLLETINGSFQGNCEVLSMRCVNNIMH